jgi:trimethylamine--corrinoid protein Co-methyltransferase
MLAAQGGANLIYGAGMIELGMAFDFAQLIIDSEIFKMVLHAARGFEVTEATLAVDIIKEVGIGGEFVSHTHTNKNFKSIQSNSSIINRKAREQWIEDGSKDMTQAAYEKAIEILETHEPVPLDPGAAATIQRIIAEAEKRGPAE